MTVVKVRGADSILVALIMLALAGCDQVKDITSGGGTKGADPTQAATGTISGQSTDPTQVTAGTGSGQNSDPTQATTGTSPGQSGTPNQTAGSGDNSPLKTWGEVLADAGVSQPAVGSQPAGETQPTVAMRRSDNFELVFDQSYQSCASCGIWFDSAELVIEHANGRFSSRQSGSLLIKEAPYHQGRFKADISAIPRSAEIRSAILYMHLNHHEGISNNDFTSTLSVSGYIYGSLSYLREITAKDDIKGRGYSKANPVVPIDFTNYAKRI